MEIASIKPSSGLIIVTIVGNLCMVLAILFLNNRQLYMQMDFLKLLPLAASIVVPMLMLNFSAAVLDSLFNGYKDNLRTQDDRFKQWALTSNLGALVVLICVFVLKIFINLSYTGMAIISFVINGILITTLALGQTKKSYVEYKRIRNSNRLESSDDSNTPINPS